MIPNQPFRPVPTTTRAKLLEAGVKLVRSHGFAATSVDDLCREAEVTKGAFFHHFASKEMLAVALADYWSQSTGAFFESAPFHHLDDPVERVMGYIDLRIALLTGPSEAFSCVAGTMLQESFLTSPAIRAACHDSIHGNAHALEQDLADAIALTGAQGVSAQSLARHVQAVIQGAFILAKTRDAANAAEAAREHLQHLRRYFEFLFSTPSRTETLGEPK